MQLSTYQYLEDFNVIEAMLKPASALPVDQPQVLANADFFRYVGELPVFFYQQDVFTSLITDTGWTVMHDYPFALESSLLGSTDRCWMYHSNPLNREYFMVPPVYYITQAETYGKALMAWSRKMEAKLKLPPQVVSWECEGKMAEEWAESMPEDWLNTALPRYLLQTNPGNAPFPIPWTEWFNWYCTKQYTNAPEDEAWDTWQWHASVMPAKIDPISEIPYPRSVFTQVLVDNIFWHWAVENNDEARTGDRNTDSVFRESDSIPGGLPCLPCMPALIGEVATLELVGVPVSIETFEDTVINIMEGEVAAGRPRAGAIQGSIYAGGYLPSIIPGIPTWEGEPSITSNSNSSVENLSETTELRPAQYAVFRVRGYYFNPKYDALSNKWRTSNANYPILTLERMSGNTPIWGQGADRRNNAAVWAEAERLAKHTYLGMFPWVPQNPVWMPNGMTPEEWVQISYEAPERLPGFQQIRRYASIDLLRIMMDYNQVMPVLFEIQTAQVAESRTINKNTKETITSETIESVYEKDPEAYPPIVETYTTYRTKITAELRWQKVPYVDSTRRDPQDSSFHPIQAKYVVLASDVQEAAVEQWDPEDPSTRSVAVTAGRGILSKIGHAFSDTDFRVDDQVMTAVNRTLDADNLGLPTLSYAQSKALTAPLLASGGSILDYLPALQEEPAKVKQVIAEWRRSLPGSTYLMQYGSPAPWYPVFKDALVLDLHLKKWGRMQQEHTNLFDLTPLNASRKRIIEASSFAIRGGLLQTSGHCYTFNELPELSEIRYGKLGYNRLGFTNIEEIRVSFVKPAKAVIQVEPSLDGDKVEGQWATTHEVSGVSHIQSLQSASARWYNITVKGHFDLKSIEFVGWKSSRR